MKRKNLSILYKPTNDCNLNCKYCYDKPYREKYKGKKLNFDDLDKTLKMASEFADSIRFVWHGGEPTLMGAAWYKKAQDYFYKYYSTNWEQGMQTNGTLINTKEWMSFLKNHNMDFGISYDALTQGLRQNGEDTVFKTLKEFKKRNIESGTITVINKKNYDRQIELYEHLKKEFDSSPAFSHVYRTKGTQENELEVEAKKFTEEFLKYFKYWLYDNSKEAKNERSVDLMLKQVLGFREQLICTYSDCRRNWIGINSNGDIYPCDRYYPEKYKFGNLHDIDSFHDIYKSEGFKKYDEDVQERMDNICKECGYLDYCKGLCNATHIAVAGTAAGIDEFSCNLFKYSFNGVYEILREIDIYNNFFNQFFVLIALESSFLTVKEIRSFLNEKGHKDIKYKSYNDKRIFDTQEYKIFRVFNQFEGEKINGHQDFQKYELDRDVEVDNEFDFKKLKENRRKLMEEIYSDNEKLIRKIINNEV